MGHVTQEIAMKTNLNDKIDMRLVDEYMHCKVEKKTNEQIHLLKFLNSGHNFRS